MEFKANVKQQNILRGDIYYADLGAVLGSEQGGVRPVVIIQNDTGNKYSPTVIAAPITSQHSKAKLPTHVEFNAVDTGLRTNSIALMEQIKVIDKSRLKSKIGRANSSIMSLTDIALAVSCYGTVIANKIINVIKESRVNA